MWSVGNQIRKLADEQNLTQKELAYKSSVSLSTISGVITCQIKDPRIATLRKIAIGLGVSVEALLVGKKPVSNIEKSVMVAPEPEKESGYLSGTNITANAILQTVETQGLLIRKLMEDIDELKKRLQ